ncbi:MAG: metallophosphoesterase family protein [Acidimicrobiales bacterium]
MRLLLFSDLHLDTHFQWAGPDAARLRRRNLRSTLTKIVKLAVDLEVDALCCGGDLYEHERFSPDTGEFLRASFEEIAPLPVFIAPGNHDWYGPASLYHQVTWSPNVHVFTENQFSPVTLEDGFTLWGAAHRAPANTPDLLSGFHVDRTGVNVALFHGSENGGFSWQEEGKVAHAPFSAEEISRAGFSHALLGHFHRPVDGPLHTYPGNADPLEFGEDGERGAVLVSVGSDGSVERQRHKVASSMVADLTLDISGTTHTGQAQEKVRQALAPQTGFVRLTLTGEISPGVDLDPAEFAAAVVAPQLDALTTRISKVRAAYDLDALAQEATVRGQFVRDVEAASDLSDDERRRVLTTGLRALAGHDDLAVR